MIISCENFIDFAYEADNNISLVTRIQNTITNIIEAIQQFILKVRSLKGERVVPRKALDAYHKLSTHCYNSITLCKNAIQKGESPNVTFKEPFETNEYKTLFSEEVKNKTSPGEYVKIASSEVLNSMSGCLNIISSSKNALRSIDKEKNPHLATAFTQMMQYARFMMKISNRVLSYKNMYVEKKHLGVTEINPDEKKEKEEQAKEAYLACEQEFDTAIEMLMLVG